MMRLLALLLVLASPLWAQKKSSYDVLVLAEGWTEEKEGKFKADAKRMCDELLDRVEPYNHFKQFIRVTPIFVPSRQQGCRRQLTRADGTVSDNKHDTFFGIVFKDRVEKQNGVERILPLPDVTPAVPGDIKKRITSAVGDTPHDFIFILSPDDDVSPGVKFDDKTYSVGVVFQSTYDFKKFPDDIAKCMAHELGHGIFGLADEYGGGGTCVVPATEPQEANITTQSDPKLVKWSYLGLGDPLPGGKYCSAGIFHPTSSCRMFNPADAKEFCVVCKERITHAMSERVSLIVSVDPGRFPKFGTGGAVPTFTVKTRCLEPDASKNRYGWMWIQDGVDVGPGTRTVSADGCTYSYTVPGGLSFGSHEVRFLVWDTLNLSARSSVAIAPQTQKWWIFSSNLKSVLPKLSKVKGWL